MAKVIHFAGWIGIAIVLCTAGITAKTWQYWAIMGCMSTIVITRALF